jgi:hypothetical protein
MMTSIRSITIIAALCGTAVVSHRAEAQDSVKVERPTSELITREQIVDNKANNVYELIEQLHSNWLIEKLPKPVSRSVAAKDTANAYYVSDINDGSGKSAPGMTGGIQVYIDGTRAGALSELKSIHLSEVYSVRRMNGTEAQGRFGIGHSSGVIYVLTLANAGRKQ